MNVRKLERTPTLGEYASAMVVILLAVVGFGYLNGGVGKRAKEVGGLPFVVDADVAVHLGIKGSSKLPWFAVMGTVFEVTDKSIYEGDVGWFGKDCTAALLVSLGVKDTNALLGDPSKYKKDVEKLWRSYQVFDELFPRVAYMQGDYYTKKGDKTKLMAALLSFAPSSEKLL